MYPRADGFESYDIASSSSISEIDPETGAVTNTNLDGNRVRRIPQFIMDFRPSYSYKHFKIFCSWQYIGDRYVNDANTEILPDYDLFNAGASYGLMQNKIKLGLNVSNLTNTIGLTEGNPRIEQAFANQLFVRHQDHIYDEIKKIKELIKEKK